MTVRGVIFDLDGTLVHTLVDLEEALSDVLVAHGRRRVSEAEVRTMIGDGARELVDRALRATGGPSPDAAAVTEEFLARYDARSTVHTRPFPGIVEAVDALLARGITLAVCTNKPRSPTLRILRSTGLLARFACVIAGDDLPDRKPDPAPVRAALAGLGVAPSQAVMIGDGAQDIAAARAAGVRSIGAGWGYGPVGGADGVAAHPDALAAAV